MWYNQSRNLLKKEVYVKQKLIVIFASGAETGGGTGAENLIEKLPQVSAVIVSNHQRGGVRQRADTLRVPFYYFPGPYTEEGYHELVQEISENMDVDEGNIWYALSGWFKKVHGLPPARTFNIHSAPLPRFGGKGMYGEKLHKAVWNAYLKGEISRSEVVMHFVTEKYDDGPMFFRFPFSLSALGNYKEYRENVRAIEHAFQPEITRLIVLGEISWDGIRPESLKVPAGYRYS
jgi:phosphoribosylglycinamide formyltransferase-1